MVLIGVFVHDLVANPCKKHCLRICSFQKVHNEHRAKRGPGGASCSLLTIESDTCSEEQPVTCHVRACAQKSPSWRRMMKHVSNPVNWRPCHVLKNPQRQCPPGKGGPRTDRGWCRRGTKKRSTQASPSRRDVDNSQLISLPRTHPL